MHYLDLNEKKQHGTEDFPVEYYYVDPSHPQYHMPYHWHMEYEMIRIRKGTFLISLDQKEITACEGDILFIHDGVLHAGHTQGLYLRMSRVRSEYAEKSKQCLPDYPAADHAP